MYSLQTCEKSQSLQELKKLTCCRHENTSKCKKTQLTWLVEHVLCAKAKIYKHDLCKYRTLHVNTTGTLWVTVKFTGFQGSCCLEAIKLFYNILAGV